MTCRRSQVRVLYRAPRVCDIQNVTGSFFVVSQVDGRAMLAPTFSIGKVDTRFSNGFISAFTLSKTVLYGILIFYKSTGKPGANRRRKAIGAHRVSQLPTRNCCFTAAGSFASFWGQELTRVKTHRYTGGTKQGIYNALLFSAARGYCLIRSDSAFRHGSAMP